MCGESVKTSLPQPNTVRANEKDHRQRLPCQQRECENCGDYERWARHSPQGRNSPMIFVHNFTAHELGACRHCGQERGGRPESQPRVLDSSALRNEVWWEERYS